jgi:hypothetical protein
MSRACIFRQQANTEVQTISRGKYLNTPGMSREEMNLEIYENLHGAKGFAF